MELEGGVSSTVVAQYTACDPVLCQQHRGKIIILFVVSGTAHKMALPSQILFSSKIDFN